MMGQIVNRNNRGVLAGPKECFIPDTGTTVPIIPMNIAKRHNLTIKPTDPDEPGCESASGHDMEIIGQMEFFTKFDSLKRIKKIRGLVTNDEGQEILLDEHTLREWSIIPPNFPEPMDEREKARVVSKNTKLVEIKDPKGSRRTSIRFIAVNDDEIEIDRK